MEVQSSLPLAPFTTFHIGGRARALIEAEREEDIQAAISFARENHLPVYVLGAGSNVLVPDAGVEGVVVRMRVRGISFVDEGDTELLIAGAGMLWEDIVDAACTRALFGIENLAGIPGTLGGAAVQNIGAYGAELSAVFAYADVIASGTGTTRRIEAREAMFGYRTSLFKEQRELVIVRVALRLAKQARRNTAYADLARLQASGVALETPSEIATAVRSIRAGKFPQSAEEGTAGSFFKNPILSSEHATELVARFPGLPAFPQQDGRVKISLAWLLDHALALKGFAKGLVRLYEKQPIVIVTRDGATAAEVDAFAEEVARKVFDATRIAIEREVETFGRA